MGDERGAEIAQATICGHYADALDKLRLPLLAAALRSDVILPENHRIRAGVWECLVPPAKGIKFVGGYYPPPGVSCDEIRFWFPSIGFPEQNPRLCLSGGGFTFFGIELSYFKQIRAVTLAGRRAFALVKPYPIEGPAIQELSFLRDATMLAPLDFFRFGGIQEF